MPPPSSYQIHSKKKPRMKHLRGWTSPAGLEKGMVTDSLHVFTLFTNKLGPLIMTFWVFCFQVLATSSAGSRMVTGEELAPFRVSCFLPVFVPFSIRHIHGLFFASNANHFSSFIQFKQQRSPLLGVGRLILPSGQVPL